MNYKREKLNKTHAIPTIFITPECKERDLEQDPTDWVLRNAKQPLPESFNSTKIDIDESPSSSDFSLMADDTSNSPPPVKKVKPNIFASPAVRILNRNATVGAAIAPKPQTSVLKSKIVKKLPTVTSPATQTKVVTVGGENYTIRKVSLAPSPKPQPAVFKKEIVQPTTCEEMVEATPAAVDPPTVVQEPEKPQENLKPILMDSLKQIAEIKQMLNDSKSQASTTSPKRSDEDANISQSQMNKVQLFNGIKRYLSPSMNALLRIELFSTPNREHKKDEKVICQELLLLGNKTYDFLTEEWRLRLPAKQDVQQWLDAKTTEEDDDAS